MSPLEATVPLDPCPLWTEPPLDGPLTMVKVTRASRRPIASGKSARCLLHHRVRESDSPLLAVISSDREIEKIVKEPSLSISRFRVSSNQRVLLLFSTLLLLLVQVLSKHRWDYQSIVVARFWITQGLYFNVEKWERTVVWCWLFIGETIVLFYTLQFWNIIGKLSKWKSKFEYWYWVQKGNRSWKNILLKLHFHSNLHRFNRAMLSITEKKKKKKPLLEGTRFPLQNRITVDYPCHLN